ncbi:MAG: hypothetical protein AAB323_02085 [Pseudomonadota bacterium]
MQRLLARSSKPTFAGSSMPKTDEEWDQYYEESRQLSDTPVEQLMQDPKIIKHIPAVSHEYKIDFDSRGNEGEVTGNVSIDLSPFWIQLVKTGAKSKSFDFRRLAELLELDTTGVVRGDLLLLTAMNNPSIFNEHIRNSPECQSLLLLLKNDVPATAAPAE